LFALFLPTPFFPTFSHLFSFFPLCFFFFFFIKKREKKVRKRKKERKEERKNIKPKDKEDIAALLFLCSGKKKDKILTMYDVQVRKRGGAGKQPLNSYKGEMRYHIKKRKDQKKPKGREARRWESELLRGGKVGKIYKPPSPLNLKKINSGIKKQKMKNK
jgi:hypothetical protein